VLYSVDDYYTVQPVTSSLAASGGDQQTTVSITFPIAGPSSFYTCHNSEFRAPKRPHPGDAELEEAAKKWKNIFRLHIHCRNQTCSNYSSLFLLDLDLNLRLLDWEDL